MPSPQQKIVQYLNEAHATELALTRVLQSQIAMTPRGSYRIRARDAPRRDRAITPTASRAASATSSQGGNPLLAVVGFAESVVGQVLALGKTPLDLLRGSGGEEKVLKNAKDAAATEALEIATYTAIERLARAVGDDETAKLAASIRADEEKMLERVLREIPKLTDAVVGADIDGSTGPTTSTTTGAGGRGRASAPRARPARSRASRRPRVQIKGAVASEGDLAIARYDSLTADEITSKPPGALADRPGQGRRLRAPRAEPLDGPQPHRHAARRRAVGRLRRADRAPRSSPCCPRATTTASTQVAHLRARAQEPRRRAHGRRARARATRKPESRINEHRRQGPQDPRRRRRRRHRHRRASRPRTTCRSPNYDEQTADAIAAKLNGFSQRELRMIGAYEAKHENRATIMDRIAKLTGDEPWSGYDEQTVDAITDARSRAPTPRPPARCSPTSATTRHARTVIDKPSARATTDPRRLRPVARAARSARTAGRRRALRR